MNVVATRPLGGFDADLTHGEIKFDEGSRWLVLEDVAWALHCILDQGAGSKLHAGCLFMDTGKGVIVNAGDMGCALTYEEAREFIERWRPDL